MAPVNDPSTYEKHPELPGQASTAALYVTHPEKATNVRELHPTEADQKLSSAGASTSLKYAKKQDLPSFPIVGTDVRTSAGTAANLANSHQKSPSLWKPGISASAGKAALLATNVKSKQLWQPELSAAGSKAALLAHRDGGKVELWAPEQTKEGNKAAGTALRMKGLAPELDYGYTAEGHEKALVAATGAISTTTRPRSGSTPNQPVAPRQSSSSHGDDTISKGALNAATVAHQPSVSYKPRANRSSFAADSAALEAARVQHLGRNVPREMFGEHPPVKLEIEEKRRQDAIHASAVSMAKQMNDVIQKKGYHNQTATPGSAGRIAGNKAQNARTAQAANAAEDLRQQALQYIHLQEAAQRSATERLKKLYTDDEAAFRDYYGYSPAPPQRSRLSVVGRPRGRASSESHPRRRRLRDDGEAVGSSDDDDDDHAAVRARVLRSQRQQPASFKEQMAPHYDEKKRQQDRVNLLAIAQRNVQSSLTSIDKRVYNETGKVPQSMQKEWEAKAKAKARANAESEARVAAMTHGKVDVGGGKFVDQAEVDAIASKRVQPTLDEINDKAEMQRYEEAERRRLALVQKEQEANLKIVMKKEKEEAKARKSEEKHTHKDGKLKSIFSGKKSSGATTTIGEHAHIDRKAEGATVADADTTTGVDNKNDNTAAIASPGPSSSPGTSKPAAVVPSTETTVVAQPSTSAKASTTDAKGTETTKEGNSSAAASPIREQVPGTEPTKSESVAKSEPKVLNVLFNRLKRKPKHQESSKAAAAAAPAAPAAPAPAPASVAMTETGSGSAVAAPAMKGDEKPKGSTTAASAVPVATAEAGNEIPDAVVVAAGLSPVDPASATPMSTLASENASTKAIISSHQPSPPPSPRQPARNSTSSVSSLSDTGSHLAAALAGDPSHPAGAEDKAVAKDDKPIENVGEDDEQEKRGRFAKSVAEPPRDKDSDNEFEDAKETKDPKELPKVTAAPAPMPTSAPPAEEKVEKGQVVDDGLAPPRASFASRTKSESPARDSKFQEQL